MIGGLADTAFKLTTEKEFGVGFKQYDELIFGKEQTDIAPFSEETWTKVTTWYWRIAAIIGGPLFIAIVILAWKMIFAGISPDKRNEIKDDIMRLFFGATAIVMAPIFVKFVLLLNNSLVKMLVGSSGGGLDKLLGNSLIENISTGNAIATALVIAMFAYLFIKMNIKFIIRQFTLIVFTVFTPIVAVFWIINKRTIASSIWFGQIIINAFMQFVYCFLFLIYMNFLPGNAGWAVSLLWAMMLLPLGDALQNMMQNLVSRVAGVNNEQLANRGIGIGAAMGNSIRTIAYQFKTSNNTNNNNENGTDLIGRIANRVMTNRVDKPVAANAESYEKHSVDIMQKKQDETKKADAIGMKNPVGRIEQNDNLKAINGARKFYNAGKEFLNMGMYMAEGKNFRNNDSYKSRRLYDRANLNETRKGDLEKKSEEKFLTKKIGDGHEK